MQILIPLLAFIVPIADTTTVVINRISRGQSPFIGGKDHTTHNLARIGLKDIQVTVVIAIISLVSAVMIILYYANPRILETWEKTILIIYLVLVFAGLYTVTLVKRKSK
jgi:UDP-GlcNAc:undecaprenyl-phosphate GlcNAc-1-phosphate transferase